MRIRLTIFLLLLTCAGIAQTQRFSGRVVDEKTGEPLPFAKVYVAPERGTMTNYEGSFVVEATPNETLKISFIGYASQEILASKLPKVVRLQPISQQMREVTVTPIQPLLVRASRKLFAEYKAHRKERSTYFLRIRQDFFRDSTTWTGHKAHMTEAFIDGYSAANLRLPVAVTGYRSGYAPKGLWGSGYQWLQMGVMVQGEEIRLADKGLITPLHPRASKKFYEKYYYITYSTLKDENGRRLRRINFRCWDDVKTPIVVGILLLDYYTLEPISFDGAIDNISYHLNVGEFKTLEPVKPRFHIDYRHDRGFTEVANLFVRNRMTKMDERYTMVNVGKTDLPEGVAFNGNFWAAIDSAGFNGDFWERHETIMRTADEDALFSIKKNGQEDVFENASNELDPNLKHHLRAIEKKKDEQRRRDSIALSRIRGLLIADSVTRKPIMLADIEVKGKHRTVSNLHGFFLCDIWTNDTLIVSANGYEQRIIPAMELRRIVYLKRLDQVPFQPKIQIDELLAALGNKLLSERTTNGDRRTTFFLRRNRVINRDTTMTEAIIEANAELQVAEAEVLRGQQFVNLNNDTLYNELISLPPQQRQAKLMEILTTSEAYRTDQTLMMQEMLQETAARTYDKMARHSGDFKKPFVPLLGTGRTRHYRRHYDLELETTYDTQGHHLARIFFNKKPNWGYPVIVGEMLVDIDSLQLLSFDGRLDGKFSVNSRTRRDFIGLRIKPNINIHYDYRHDHGFTEVWHAGFYTSMYLSYSKYSSEEYIIMNCSDMPFGEEDEIGNTVVRTYEEEQFTRHPKLPFDELLPPLITFDIFSEKADWRWIM